MFEALARGIDPLATPTVAICTLVLLAWCLGWAWRGRTHRVEFAFAGAALISLAMAGWWGVTMMGTAPAVALSVPERGATGALVWALSRGALRIWLGHAILLTVFAGAGTVLAYRGSRSRLGLVPGALAAVVGTMGVLMGSWQVVSIAVPLLVVATARSRVPGSDTRAMQLEALLALSSLVAASGVLWSGLHEFTHLLILNEPVRDLPRLATAVPWMGAWSLFGIALLATVVGARFAPHPTPVAGPLLVLVAVVGLPLGASSPAQMVSELISNQGRPGVSLPVHPNPAVQGNLRVLGGCAWVLDGSWQRQDLGPSVHELGGCGDTLEESAPAKRVAVPRGSPADDLLEALPPGQQGQLLVDLWEPDLPGWAEPFAVGQLSMSSFAPPAIYEGKALYPDGMPLPIRGSVVVDLASQTVTGPAGELPLEPGVWSKAGAHQARFHVVVVAEGARVEDVIKACIDANVGQVHQRLCAVGDGGAVAWKAAVQLP